MQYKGYFRAERVKVSPSTACYCKKERFLGGSIPLKSILVTCNNICPLLAYYFHCSDKFTTCFWKKFQFLV